MPKVTRIYQPNTREQVSCLTQLVGIQKKHLVEILESIKPAVLTAAVPADGDSYADLGMHFQVTKGKKYALKIECSFADNDNDGRVDLSIGPIANIQEFKMFGFCMNSLGVSALAEELNSYAATYQGVSWVPPTESAVVIGYATMYFQVIESAILSLTFDAGSGDALMLAGSNFTLTEIETND